MSWEIVGLAEEVAERLGRRRVGFDRVYVIEMRPGVVKIGFTTDVAKRIREILRYQRIYGVDSVGRAAVSMPHSRGRITEALLHDRFDHCRLAGELFTTSIDEVGKVVETFELEIGSKDADAARLREEEHLHIRAVINECEVFMRGVLADVVKFNGLEMTAKYLGARPALLAGTIRGDHKVRARWLVLLIRTDPRILEKLLSLRAEECQRNAERTPSPDDQSITTEEENRRTREWLRNNPAIEKSWKEEVRGGRP